VYWSTRPNKDRGDRNVMKVYIVVKRRVFNLQTCRREEEICFATSSKSLAEETFYETDLDYPYNEIILLEMDGYSRIEIAQKNI
jgi:hypothetical protein